MPELSHATGSVAYAADGRRFVDLVTGFGAVFLGHCHPEVTARVSAQMGRLWACGRYPTPALAEANARIRDLLPAGMRPAGLYSTGMEVAEFAMRVAATSTGRNEFVGFARSMHGKSATTAGLCWENGPVGSDRVRVLPFIGAASEDDILERLAEALRGGRIAAVFVEPIQGSNGAREASRDFYDRVIAGCRGSGTLCVFDEILTGLYRTGTAFYSDRLAERPDVLLFAKCMGNGFPASAIAVREDVAIGAAALPGSTFSENPLAAAAVAATLAAMRSLPMTGMVAAIESTVRAALGGREDIGITLRGRGALWALELGPRVRMEAVLRSVGEDGLLVSSHGRHIRVLPAATIDVGDLRDACGRIARACAAAQD